MKSENNLVGSVAAMRQRDLSVSALVFLVFAASAAVCDAQTNNLTVNAVTFNTGAVLSEGISSVVVPEGGCGVATVTADSTFVDAYGNVYDFMFWNIDATPYSTEEVSFQTLCTSASTATAWFLELGTGGGPAAISTWAFSLNHNSVIANTTPIQSVTNGTWAGGSSTVVDTTGTAPITITALPKIAGYGRFMDWQLVPDGPLESGSTLNFKPGSSAWEIAFYGIPVPDPCETLRLELQSCLEDLSGKACLPIGKALEFCESTYGED
jgi:hypothetical protein